VQAVVLGLTMENHGRIEVRVTKMKGRVRKKRQVYFLENCVTLYQRESVQNHSLHKVDATLGPVKERRRGGNVRGV